MVEAFPQAKRLAVSKPLACLLVECPYIHLQKILVGHLKPSSDRSDSHLAAAHPVDRPSALQAGSVSICVGDIAHERFGAGLGKMLKV